MGSRASESLPALHDAMMRIGSIVSTTRQPMHNLTAVNLRDGTAHLSTLGDPRAV